MVTDKRMTCPHCNEDFDASEAVWHVCLTCGEVFPPGEDWAGHGPGPTYVEAPDDSYFGRKMESWPCNSARRFYNERDATEFGIQVKEEV